MARFHRLVLPVERPSLECGRAKRSLSEGAEEAGADFQRRHFPAAENPLGGQGFVDALAKWRITRDKQPWLASIEDLLAQLTKM